LRLLRTLDEWYLKLPFFGSRKMAVQLGVGRHRVRRPEIWNSDQGSQFTSADFLAPLKKRGISISMDGRGRALDNVFIERLWRSLKYELLYPGDFSSGLELFPALENYFHFYNHQRPQTGGRDPGSRARHDIRYRNHRSGGRTRRSAIGRRPICSPTDSKGKDHLSDGGLRPPNPSGIYRFPFPEWMFLLYCNGTCRTIERLDGKTGLRRDATRAPMQARNGWRPHGRRLGQPATPSKNGRNFVHTTRTTSGRHFYSSA